MAEPTQQKRMPPLVESDIPPVKSMGTSISIVTMLDEIEKHADMIVEKLYGNKLVRSTSEGNSITSRISAHAFLLRNISNSL